MKPVDHLEPERDDKGHRQDDHVVGVEVANHLEKLDHKAFHEDQRAAHHRRRRVLRLCGSRPPTRISADRNQPSIRTPAAFSASSCFDFVASVSGFPAM